MTDRASSRRTFLSQLGALSAVGVMPTDAWSAPVREPRGLAGPDDFAFAKGLTFLQTGSLGPTPRPVRDRTMAYWATLDADPVTLGYGEFEHAMDDVRAKAAAFIGCKVDELVLTRCTTEGMNWVATGIAWSAGDRVLTTDQEHPGGRVCWNYIARRHGVAIDVVNIPPGENDPEAVIDRFTRQMTPRTRVLSFSHLLTSTGFRMPVAELSALARARGALSVVDGAQAVGGVAVNVKALGCHVYATSGHKWLLAPKGTGLLYLSEELGKTIDPVSLEGGRTAYSDSSGVCSIPSVLGLGAAIDYHNQIGNSSIEAHNIGLRDKLYAALQSVPVLKVVSAAPGKLTSPLLTYQLPSTLASGPFHQRLRDKYNIEVKVVPKNFMNGHRISTHLFNTERDVDTLVSALRSELT